MKTTKIEICIKRPPMEVLALYRKMVDAPINKDITLEMFVNWCSSLIESHLMRMDMMSERSDELESSEIIKPLTLNHELVGRIKEHFHQTQ
jgi:hypothetical protein